MKNFLDRIKKKFRLEAKKFKDLDLGYITELERLVNKIFVPVFNINEIPEILFNPSYILLKNDFVEEYLISLPNDGIANLRKFGGKNESIRKIFGLLEAEGEMIRVLIYFLLFQEEGIELFGEEGIEERIFGEGSIDIIRQLGEELFVESKKRF